MFIHSAGFVHKNIRPETILVMREKESGRLFAFLTGFESFRLAEGKTYYQGDESWEESVPPPYPVKDTSRRRLHDAARYLFSRILPARARRRNTVHSYPGRRWENSAWPAVDSGLKDRRKFAFEMKRALVLLAQTLLPSKMGRKYVETVVTCLTCLYMPPDNEFGDESEFLDEDGVLVGVRFIEKVGNLLRPYLPTSFN
jgi:hypothetical protein